MYVLFVILHLSVISSYLGQVVASDSKRGHLCSIVGSCLYLIKGSDRNCRGNGHGRRCTRQRVVERGARAASHLRCEMRAKTQGLPRFGPPEGKDLLLLDCIMEVLQWASSAARRRVAWVYEGTCLYSPHREVYISSPPLGFTYLNRFGYSFGNRLT